MIISYLSEKPISHEICLFSGCAFSVDSREGNKVLICHVAYMGFLNQMQRRGRDAAEIAAAVNYLDQMDKSTNGISPTPWGYYSIRNEMISGQLPYFSGSTLYEWTARLRDAFRSLPRLHSAFFSMPSSECLR